MERKFEPTELTKLVEQAIKRTIYSIQCSGDKAPTIDELQLAGKLHGLLEKMYQDQLDVNFISREF